MPSPMPRLLCALGVLAGALSGCTTTPAPIKTDEVLLPQPQEAAMHDAIPVIRQGRYTLVELIPELAQRELMQQVADIAVPLAPGSSVGDAMHQVLQHSGYQLCEAPEAAALYALPLPAVHQQLGPLVLREALLTLAGAGWEMVVDEASRQVCFTRRVVSPP